jgi:hypothetical protein
MLKSVVLKLFFPFFFLVLKLFVLRTFLHYHIIEDTKELLFIRVTLINIYDIKI